MAEYKGKYKSVYCPGIEFESDYIAREAARDLMYHNQYPLTEYDLNDLPPADVRPVVLCRDCKHKGWIQEPCHGKSIDYCRILEHPVEIRFFCAAGERKESDG